MLHASKKKPGPLAEKMVNKIFKTFIGVLLSHIINKKPSCR